MEGCIGIIPAHEYVSAMERCAKMFLHQFVINIPAHESGMEECVSKYRVNAHSYTMPIYTVPFFRVFVKE